jgi:DNA-binding NarL/FixJ family response regulator
LISQPELQTVTPMHLLLIEDHTVVAEGLQFLLREIDSTITVYRCSNLSEAKAAKLTRATFNMVLMDLGLPDVSGLAGLNDIRALYDEVPVVVLSGEENVQVIHAAINAGAMGFVPKSASSKVLVAAMRLILAGGTYLPPQAYNSYIPTVPATGAGNLPRQEVAGEAKNMTVFEGGKMTDRQLEILLKAVQGKPNKVIARETDLAEGTVKAHLSAAYKIINVSNRTEAVFKAAQLGLMMPETVRKT